MKPDAKALNETRAKRDRGTKRDVRAKQESGAKQESRLPQHHWGSFLFSVACFLTLALVVAAVFGGARHFDIVNFDDPLHLTGNPFIQPDSPDRFAHFWRESYGKLYVPITYNIWAVVYEKCFDPSTGLFDASLLHGLNVTIHALNAGLMFLLLRRLLRDHVALSAHRTAGAMFGALLFAVHPLQVESVAWVSEFRGLLAALFGLSAWVIHSHAPDVRSRARRLTLEALSTLCFAAALLSKPSAAAVPLMVVATDLLLLRRSWKHVAVVMAPWLLLSLACLVRMRTLQVVDATYAGPLTSRPLIAIDSIVFYLGKLIWPTRLCADYSRTPGYVLGTTGIWWMWIVPAMFAGLLMWKPIRIAIAAAVVFALALSPVLGLVPFEFQRLSTVADRYAYLALIGPSIGVSMLLARWPRALLVALPAVIALAVLSHRQCETWKDDRSLWTHASRVNDRAFIATANLARAAGDAGDLVTARTLFDRVIEIDPRRSNGYLGRGSLLLETGSAADSLPWFDKAAAAEPDLAEPHAMSASALRLLGRNAEARTRLALAQRCEPRSLQVLNDMADLDLTENRLDEAARLTAEALTFNPRDVRSHLRTAMLAAARNDVRAQVDALNKAARFSGSDPEPLDRLGKLALRLQDWPAAIESFQRSLKRFPGQLAAMVDLATALAQAGRLDEAEAQLIAAERLAPDSPVIRNNLQSVRTLRERSTTPTNDEK